jgi:hypothetical protein
MNFKLRRRLIELENHIYSIPTDRGHFLIIALLLYIAFFKD